jgi:hypothetical protein
MSAINDNNEMNENQPSTDQMQSYVFCDILKKCITWTQLEDLKPTKLNGIL